MNENNQTASAAPRLVVYTNQSETHPTDQWKSITRPCVESQVSCKSVAICVLASDCLEKQEKILRQLEEKRTSSETGKENFELKIWNVFKINYSWTSNYVTNGKRNSSFIHFLRLLSESTLINSLPARHGSFIIFVQFLEKCIC